MAITSDQVDRWRALKRHVDFVSDPDMLTTGAVVLPREFSRSLVYDLAHLLSIAGHHDLAAELRGEPNWHQQQPGEPRSTTPAT